MRTQIKGATMLYVARKNDGEWVVIGDDQQLYETPKTYELWQSVDGLPRRCRTWRKANVLEVKVKTQPDAIEHLFENLVRASLHADGVTPMPAIVMQADGTQHIFSIADSDTIIKTVFGFVKSTAAVEFMFGLDSLAKEKLGLSSESLVVVFHITAPKTFKVGYIPYTGMEMGTLCFDDCVAYRLKEAYCAFEGKFVEGVNHEQV